MAGTKDEMPVYPNFKGFSLADIEISFKKVEVSKRADEILVAFYTHRPFDSPEQARQYLDMLLKGGEASE